LTATFRRRVDNIALRWQARLDSEWADRVLPWLVALGLFVWLAALALARARSLEGATALAEYTQAGWLIREGESPVQTITTGAHLLAQQASFLFYPMLGITFVLSIIPGLLLLQSAALAVAVVPLWRIARRIANLRVGAAGTLLAVYALYPVMHNLNLDGFHPEVVAIPGLLSAFYFGLTGRWRPFVLCCAVVVLARADLGLAIAGLGALLMVEGRRRPGLITLAAGGGWTLLCFLAVQPLFGDGGFPHVDAFGAYGDAPLSVVWGMVTQPGEVLQDLFSERNFNLLVTLFAPVLFLPLLAPRYLIPVLPLQALFMVADVADSAAFGQQTVAITAFIFIATAMALSKIGRLGVEKIMVDKRVLGALLLAGTVFFVRDAASSPYREPWDWGGQDVVDGARLDAQDIIPRDASVRASRSMLQVLAERRTLYELVLGDEPDAVGAGSGVDYVVIDEREVPDWTQVERQIFRQGLESAGFEVVFDTEGVTVFERADSVP
jgi:uncharacterized membrane protein